MDNALKAINTLKKHFKPTPNAITALIIAYYNAGVQLDIMDNRQEALKYYQSAMELSLEQLGMEHSLTMAIAKTHRCALELTTLRRVQRNFENERSG